MSEPLRPGATRRALLCGAAGTLLGGAAVARAAPRVPPDVEQLEHLLALEQRLEGAYEAALARDAIEPALGQTLLAHERQHVRALEETLRGRGRRAPRATVPSPRLGAALTSRTAFARHALELEAETVTAYQEALATLASERLLQPLASIMAAGAQHQVALRRAAGERLLARVR